MNDPLTRAPWPMHAAMDIPARNHEQPVSVPKKAIGKHTGIAFGTWMKWLSVLVLLITGIILYELYRVPRAGFREPLSVPFRLSGNFGELRSNHFHMGLDVRTNGQENLPVYAVADGYISRIIIEQYGLGKAIFITHPNGYTTVYAHLNRFYSELEAVVEAQQITAQKREQDIHFAASRFPVRKGQLIARSGNTGASEAPHLHFEVRNTRTGNNLNPLLHGFDMADDQPPVLKGLYWYNRQYSTYHSAANSITIEGREGAYQAARKVIKVRSPLISLGIRAEDKSNDNRFLFGIYRTELRLDDSLVHQAILDNFSCADSRYINACVDYSKWIRTGLYVQHLSILPGNHLPVLKGNGILNLSDGRVHNINIRLYDVNNNVTTFESQVQYSGATEEPYPTVPGSFTVLPGKESVVTGRQCKVFFSKAAFYDTVRFVLKAQPHSGAHKASASVTLHNSAVPVHDNYTVSLKALPFVTERLKKRIVMQLNSGKKKYVAKGIWKDNWLTAHFNTLGTVQLLIDTLPPMVQPVNWQHGQSFTEDVTELKLLCKDETDGVADFRAILDGEWLLFDRKGDDFTLHIPENTKRGKHRLTITIIDVAGNQTQQVFSFVKKG
jgi:hypothetical protein